MKKLIVVAILAFGLAHAAGNTTVGPTGDAPIKFLNSGVKTSVSDVNPLPVNLASSSGSMNVAVTSPLDGSGNVKVSASSLPLPTGASTAALQTTGNTALSTINTTLGTPMQNSGGSVTANIGTTNGLALDTTVSGLHVSQGSTTSGQSGDLVQGAVTTAAPSYTTGKTSPLSLTTGGLLRMDGSGVTQPVSAASLPLPSGAATSAKQPALGTAGSASTDVITVQGITGMTALKVDGSAVTQPVSGTFWQATQPVSAASLPLPSGASTAAKQPALGTAGSASSDVITVQGIASMTALKVDNSGVTQPVSNAGTFAVQNTEVRPSSATLSNVASSASNTTCLSSNSARRMATFYNDSTQVAYLKLGTTASATSYTVQLAAGGYYEMPSPAYTGNIDCIWASANGNMRVTEY